MNLFPFLFLLGFLKAAESSANSNNANSFFFDNSSIHPFMPSEKMTDDHVKSLIAGIGSTSFFRRLTSFDLTYEALLQQAVFLLPIIRDMNEESYMALKGCLKAQSNPSQSYDHFVDEFLCSRWKPPRYVPHELPVPLPHVSYHKTLEQVAQLKFDVKRTYLEVFVDIVSRIDELFTLNDDRINDLRNCVAILMGRDSKYDGMTVPNFK